jgi:hypothetical protein
VLQIQVCTTTPSFSNSFIHSSKLCALPKHLA